MDLLPAELQDAAVLRRIIFAATYLPKDVPHYWSIVGQFSGAKVDPEVLRVAVENLHTLNEAAFASDEQLTKELQGLSPSADLHIGTPLGLVLISNVTSCRLCDGKLLLRQDRSSRITVYTESMGTVVGSHYHKFCQNFRKGCSLRQYYGYSSEGNQTNVFYDANWAEHKFFVSSSETAFESTLLRKFDADLLLGQLSYSQKAEIYNDNHGYPVLPKKCSTLNRAELPTPRESSVVHELHHRLRLDRRRFEAAHLKYAILTTQSRYPQIAAGSIAMNTDISATLEAITPTFYHAFTTRYADHKCEFPGCKHVLVLDGNMKNRRDICFAKDAGSVSYAGLPGHIKTGCMASPAFKSPFCIQHKDRSCSTVDHGLDGQSTSPSQEAVIEMVLAVKETRGTKYYQVLWLGKPDVQVTWEPASSLPPRVIEEFEKGIEVETCQHSTHQYGYEASTLVTLQKPESQPRKKARRDRPFIQKSTGALVEDTQSQTSCNTEKDRHITRNQRTAGILAGLRPCGIIVLLCELYTAESKTQVYGCLHDYYTRHPTAAKDIEDQSLHAEFICYDDACHLVRFSRNPVRAHLTPQTEQLTMVNMVVDKMHFKGHTDKWCKEHCDPSKFEALHKVDTEVCEQTFSWLSRYARITHKMNQHTFMFYLLYVCDLHNLRELKKLQKAGF